MSMISTNHLAGEIYGQFDGRVGIVTGGRDFGPFRLEVSEGIATASFDRPPVNAFDLATYQALHELVEHLEQRDDARVVVLTAPEGARCWCGGADLRDFVGMDQAGRAERYAFINAVIPRLSELERPVVAAITGDAIGIGVLLAAVADLRVAADSAAFSCPEIDYGLIAGSSRLLTYLGVPEGLVREMVYTGRRMTARSMHSAGFLNYVVPAAEVLPTAMSLATEIAAKSLPALRARKRAFTAHERMGWLEAYQFAQRLSGELVGHGDSQEGVRAFLERRRAVLGDA
ncbi:enoyl-CoA hydratase/isomerase family protein [Acrocarpospora catenulata]|uniref:enoyl-CoA hydratase/isomerase family protein n=1 Tax=Acrocarpospora catenulata TaxID=2836182 RepID=UPI001BDAF055|nr:enoyl-CoA hydratase/isomerase family protein [Acrocarpospora catenulata]